MREQRVAEIKAKLADMQRRKGKAVDIRDEVELSTEQEEREAEESESLRRESKHASVLRLRLSASILIVRSPTAISTKKQVSRMRRVVDVPKPVSPSSTESILYST